MSAFFQMTFQAYIEHVFMKVKMKIGKTSNDAHKFIIKIQLDGIPAEEITTLAKF